MTAKYKYCPNPDNNLVRTNSYTDLFGYIKSR